LVHLRADLLGDGGAPEERNQYGNDLMFLSQIKTQLLPPLLKEAGLERNSWRTVDSAEVESAMRDLVAEIQQHKHYAKKQMKVLMNNNCEL
jgi:hypothetical protein